MILPKKVDLAILDSTRENNDINIIAALVTGPDQTALINLIYEGYKRDKLA